VPICLNSLQTAITGLRDPFQGGPRFVIFRSDLSFYDGDSRGGKPSTRLRSALGAANETVEGRYVMLKSGFASSITTVVDLETSDGVKTRSFLGSARICHVDFPGYNGTSHRDGRRGKRVFESRILTRAPLPAYGDSKECYWRHDRHLFAMRWNRRRSSACIEGLVENAS